MNTLRLIMVTMMVLSFNSFSFSQDAENKKKESVSETVNVYYFHNTRRCATCEAVEDVTKQTLEETYPEQMKNGSITFQSFDLEDNSNEALARKLHVSGQTLMIVKNGKKKDLTNEAFMYARSKPDKLKEKIIAAINKL